ncbi:MAG: outer membrane lipoprotein carrier protein LolA [Deltaproteobacteria bacterium]|nr:outer membrane lipoprotein carrier protein LolA [Deltaproteobacteria bacterium]
MKSSPARFKNKLGLCLVGCLIPAIVHARSLTNTIDTIETVYQDTTDLSASFIQETNVELLNKTVRQRGKIFLKKGGKLRIEYSSPERKLYLSDGQHLWVATEGDAHADTYDLSNDIIPHDALSFLIGFGKVRRAFRVSASTAFGTLAPSATALHLKPKSKRSPYVALDLLFDKDHIVQQLIIQNPSGNRSTYQFQGVRINSGLADTLFQP